MDAIKEYLRIADRLEHEEITPLEYEELCEPLRNVVERKRGEWIEYKCSICGFEPYNPSGLETFNYCSNCGAKMEKKDD